MNLTERFLEGVSRRLSRYRAGRNALRAVFFVGLSVLVSGIACLLQGVEIPRELYLGGGLAAGMLCLLCYGVSRTSRRRASRFADGYFDLKDGLVSARSFARENCEGAFYELQRRQTEEALQGVMAHQLQLPFPVRWMLAVVAVGLAILVTSFIPPWSYMAAKRAQEADVFAKGAELKEQLERALDTLEQEITDPEERTLLQEANLHEFLKELQTTTDLKEAMRQYAALERRVARATSVLDQRRDEHLLSRAAEELFKEPEHRQLADRLKTHKYKDAAKRLQELQLKPRAAKGQDGVRGKRERLRKLQSASRRMASAAKRGRRSSSKQNDESISEELAGLLKKLDELAQKLGLTMDDAERDASQNGGKPPTAEELKKLLAEMEKLDQQLDQLGSKMREMEAKRDLQGKMRLLGVQLSKAQGYLAGNLNSPFASPGGQKPGEGTSEERRKQRDAVVDNGQNTQLKGIQGVGPSQIQAEDASEGGGISRLQADEVERSFAKQLEAFVQREDVPEDLKDGVREYFTTIHQPDNESNETVER